MGQETAFETQQNDHPWLGCSLEGLDARQIPREDPGSHASAAKPHLHAFALFEQQRGNELDLLLVVKADGFVHGLIR